MAKSNVIFQYEALLSDFKETVVFFFPNLPHGIDRGFAKY